MAQARFGKLFLEDGLAGQHAAGKNVALDEIDAFAVALEQAVIDGDDLERRLAALFQAVENLGEIARPVGFTDCLEHFDRGDPVIEADMVAIVLQADIDLLGKAFALHAGQRVIALGGGDGQAGDLAAPVPGGIFGKAAPATADLEDAAGRAGIDAVADAFVFDLLGLLERLVGAFKHGRRIGHAGIEPLAVEIIAEIVVCHDVAAGTGLRIPVEQVADHIGPAHDHAAAGELAGCFKIGGEELQYGGQVGC